LISKISLHPLPAARELLPKIATILRFTQDALDMPLQFDPAPSTRSFRLAGSDLVGALIAPSLFSLLRHARSASDPGLDWLATKIVQAGQG
jgi:DNA-binding transcriptional LysR family regulator